jgi:D-alanine-D-alanine ligase
MLISLTYDLRDDYLAAGYSLEETAEFDGIATIEAIDAALGECGHQTDRIGNGRQLVQRLAAGDRWDLVFNIAEGLHGVAREAQVPAILGGASLPGNRRFPAILRSARELLHYVNTCKHKIMSGKAGSSKNNG